MRVGVIAIVLLGLLAGCASAPGRQESSPTAAAAHHHHHHDHGHSHGHGHHHHHHPPLDHEHFHSGYDPQSACVCAASSHHNLWCRRCNVGFIAGQRIESAILFDTLDAHGHDIRLDSITCASCRRAFASEGFCDECGMGFVGGMAYFSRLTHGLAQGRQIDPARIRCAGCRANAAESGWCNRCSRGMVGNVAFTDRSIYERTVSEYNLLLAAIERTQGGGCELCACALATHRTCPTCLISFRNGVVVDTPGPGVE